MTGPAVMAIVAVISALLVAAYVVGEAELEDVLARWRAERDDREAVDEWARLQRALSPRWRP